MTDEDGNAESSTAFPSSSLFRHEDEDGNAELSMAFPSSSLFQYDGDDTSFNLVVPVAPVIPLDGGRQVRLGGYGFS